MRGALQQECVSEKFPFAVTLIRHERSNSSLYRSCLVNNSKARRNETNAVETLQTALK